MRNIDYQDDQKVFRFINSESCNTYIDLSDFLKENNLPYRERWVFYFFGKTNLIDEKSIKNMSSKDQLCYGGLIEGEVLHWQNYFSQEYKTKDEIREELFKSGQNEYWPTAEEVNKIFLERGFSYVENRIENDYLSAEDQAGSEYDEMMRNAKYNSDDDTSYCGACESSTCICSDPERTSTIKRY